MPRSPDDDIRHSRPGPNRQRQQGASRARQDSPQTKEPDQFSPTIRYLELESYSRQRTFYGSWGRTKQDPHRMDEAGDLDAFYWA